MLAGALQGPRGSGSGQQWARPLPGFAGPGRPPGILPSAPAGGHHCSDSVAVACAEHALHCGSVRQLRMQDVDLPPSAYYAGAAGHHHRTSSGAWAAVLHHCGHAIASHCRERLGLPLNRLASRSCRVGPSLTFFDSWMLLVRRESHIFEKQYRNNVCSLVLTPISCCVDFSPDVGCTKSPALLSGSLVIQ